MVRKVTDRPDTHPARLVPFVLVGLLPFLLLPLPGPGLDPALAAVGGALTVGAVLLFALTPWSRLSPAWRLAPAVVYLASVAILREAGGGNVSGLGPLVIVPAIGLALFAPRRLLAVGVVGAALVYWLPIPLIDDPERYPSSGWRIGLLLACMSMLLGLAIHRLREGLAEQAERLRSLALEDELTGLPNRRAWTTTVEGTLARSARHGAPVCVAVIDVDDFKAVNDRGGHAAGDRLLASLATAWSDVVRGGDVLARLGGDEFGVVMTATTLDDALVVLERVRACSEGVTCSIGVAEWDRTESGDALLGRADRLLYAAKRAGRDRVEAGRVPTPA